MSATYPSLFSLSNAGVEQFQRYMRGEALGDGLLVPDPALATIVQGTGTFVAREFRTAKEMAAAVCAAFGDAKPQEYAGDIGLWAWLTIVLADQLYPFQDGTRDLKELYRWFPAPPGDWQKAQRHLIRMPTLLFAAFGDDVDHLLHTKPATLPEIREQLTSQQDMFSANFQRACRQLYWDEAAHTVKKLSGSKDRPGTSRRLAAVRKQLDFTWDMSDLEPARILALLPTEFDGFKVAAA